jgi:hypothetical protein
MLHQVQNIELALCDSDEPDQSDCECMMYSYEYDDFHVLPKASLIDFNSLFKKEYTPVGMAQGDSQGVSRKEYSRMFEGSSADRRGSRGSNANTNGTKSDRKLTTKANQSDTTQAKHAPTLKHTSGSRSTALKHNRHRLLHKFYTTPPHKRILRGLKDSRLIESERAMQRLGKTTKTIVIVRDPAEALLSHFNAMKCGILRHKISEPIRNGEI